MNNPRSSRLDLTAGVALCLLGASCLGSVAGDPAESDDTGSTSGNGGSRGSEVDQNGNPILGGGGAAPNSVACGKRVDPGFSPIRLLTINEYANTVRDLVGIDPLAQRLVSPESSTTTFERTSQTFSFSSLAAHSFMDVAEAAGKAITATAESRAKFIGCEPSSANCLGRFASSFGRRAFRRALSPDEVAALITLANEAKDDPNPYAGAGLIVRAIMQSPKFLMHVEIGKPEPGGTRHKLTGPEVASRLSYLLRGTAPNDALLSSAESGGLDDADKVQAAAKAMLSETAVHAQIRSFFHQWLGLSRLKSTSRDPKSYPLWNDGLRLSMEEETLRIIDDFVWTNQRNFGDLLDTPETFVDAKVAKLYGLTAPASGFAKVTMAGTSRVGLLTHASLLTLTAEGDVTPIRRGKYIRDTLLCKPPPSVPATVPDLPKAIPGQTQRQRLESHRTNPTCAACHALLDPLGFGFSRFDDIGAYQSTDASGNPISDEGSFAEALPPEFRGPKELALKLRKTDDFQACVVEKLVEFSFARNIAPSDACVSESINQSFAASGYKFQSAVVALVRNEAFRYRRDPAKEGQTP